MKQKQHKLYKFLISGIYWLILSFLFQISFQLSFAIAGEKLVTIVQSQQISAYNEVIKGFEEACKGENISIKAIYDLKGDIEKGKRTVQNIKIDKLQTNLILAVGVLATTLVKEQFPDIPIIFCMVINHERFDFQGANITGISCEASVEDQFTILKELHGANKNIGVIYDPWKTGKIISEAILVAKKLESNLIKTEVASEKEVAPAIKNIINKISALWIVPDGTVITKETIDGIIKLTQKHRLPTFCTSPAIVKAGALVSISPDYTYMGLQAAQLAQTLLSDQAITSLGIKQPEKLKFTVNTRTAEIIGVNLSSFKSCPDVVLIND